MADDNATTGPKNVKHSDFASEVVDGVKAFQDGVTHYANMSINEIPANLSKSPELPSVLAAGTTFFVRNAELREQLRQGDITPEKFHNENSKAAVSNLSGLVAAGLVASSLTGVGIVPAAIYVGATGFVTSKIMEKLFDPLTGGIAIVASAISDTIQGRMTWSDVWNKVKENVQGFAKEYNQRMAGSTIGPEKTGLALASDTWGRIYFAPYIRPQ